MRTLAGIALPIWACALPVWAGPPAAQIRLKEAQGAERAIVRLQASQKSWYGEQSCASCHHQFLPALALREAREHGLRVDEKVAHADAAQAFAMDADLDRAVEHARIVDPGIGDAYSLLSADAAGVRPSMVTAVYARFLAQRQKPDGHWNTFDQRPPQSSSVVSATALALRVVGGPYYRGTDARARIDQARRWLLTRVPRDTEERAFQLLGLKWSGANRSALESRAKEIERQQQADGGWGSLEGRAYNDAHPSDAYSTGEVVAALEEAGFGADPSALRGIEWLIRTQQPDGTWHVASRLYPPAPLSPDYFESGYPYGHDQMISALGASWAIMALARALPPAGGPARKTDAQPLREATPAGVEQWSETVLFGSVDDLRRLLDSGFDPNSATKAGTTALMLAAPDVGKLKLLLDRGAKINARNHDGYSPLLMAALYADSAPALRMLLEHGAELGPKDGSPEALFHAYPAVLAAIAGNAEGVTLLHQAGDNVNGIYDYAGIEPAAPLLLLSSFDDAAVVRALLDSGAKADQADTDGLTPLLWAVLSNQVQVAELLLAHGADVNHTDKHGMTALLYAASIDFGDSAMIDLLLRQGARTDARTPESLTAPEGLTALDLARKYRHTHLLKSLGG